MATSTDVATIKAQRYLNEPIVERCRHLAILINESSTTELQLVFPLLIDSLFGIIDNIGWCLHNITKQNPLEFETLCHFLSPQGPMFSLCYKLLPDCYLKYNFPVSYLPSKIRSMLEEAVISPFYLDKIKDDQGIRVPSALSMNPFEYYIFHFAYHLTNPWLQQQENIWAKYDTVYFELANCYLNHFLPRDNSTVLPVIGPYIKKTPPRKLTQSPEFRRDCHRLQTPRLLRTSILSPGSASPGSSVPQQQCLPQVWRSETVVQVFLDFWLEYTESQQLTQLSTSYLTSIPRRDSIHSGEHIRLVRQFIKTLHEFTNSATGDKSAMDELKRIILPSVQGKIYTFLRKAIYHWPLDGSFRLVLEAWLSFIQPWRYTPGIMYTTNEGKIEEEERGKIYDTSRWISFVANNLLAYTAVFQQLLPRFMRTDLVAPKNATMLYRVTKVFSQLHLARMICEVENCIDDVGLSKGRLTTNQWTSVVRQQILELEGLTYQYVPMFSSAITSQVVWFLSTIKQAHLTATSLVEALENRRKGKRFLLSLWEYFSSESSSDDINIEERRRVPYYLATAQQQLIDIFQIKLEDIPQVAIVADQEYHDSILSTSFCHQSQVECSFDTSKPGTFVPLQEGRQTCRYIEYMGDPELQPVRTNECGFLVRNFYKLCCYINLKYRYKIITLYNSPNFLGSISRQLLIPPTTVVKLPKRSPTGFTSGYEERLPARLSLRPLANYTFLLSVLFGILIAWLTNYSPFTFLGFALWVWIMYIIIRAALQHCFPSSTSTLRSNVNTFSINR